MKSLHQERTDDEKRDVGIFNAQLIQIVVGIRYWQKAKSKVLISDAITKTQEATSLWILNNYENKWNKGGSETIGLEMFTGCTRGNMVFNGWSLDGIQEYNSIIDHIMNDRRLGL